VKTTSTGGAGTGGTGTKNTSTVTTPTFTFPVSANAWQPSAACVTEVKTRLGKMTLAEKVGQMVQGNSDNAKPSDVTTTKLGSVLSGGDADPSGSDAASAWVTMTKGFTDSGVSMGLPILYGIDAVHGNNNVSGSVIFPHNIGLGCTRNPALVEETGKITALEMRGAGVNWAFSPVVAAGRDERWGRTYETFAETPELAAEMGLALMRGLQGSSLSAKTSVLACAKHFAGDGATANGKNEGNSTLTEAEFKKFALDQYQPLINAGVGTIMVSYSSYNGTKMHGHKALLTDTLKGTMGFKGFLVSDWRAVQQIGADPASVTDPNPAPTQAALATSINAGLDMVMEPAQFVKVAQYIQDSVTASQIPQSRVDDAVTRILQVKCEMGLLESGYNGATDASLTSQIGSAEHRAVGRKAVRESLVLLRNEGNVLPFPKTAKVLVAGTAANDKSKQCGGWTVDWQGLGTKGAGGKTPEPGDTTVTTILQGIQNAVGTSNVTFEATGTSSATGITHAIVVVGESTYAESKGDSTNLALSAVSAADVTAINNVAALGIPTVVVVVSGRPLIISDYLTKAKAWIAAWLPGSEGDGVADVIFGAYAPTGKLSHSWPKTMTQIPINVGDADYTSDPPQFAYGFGLTY
jgi:beta-glucosidase